MKASFFTYFTSAYGVLWLGYFYLSLCFIRQIQIGLFVMIGFPLISLLYGLCRMALGKNDCIPGIIEIKEDPLYAKFIKEDNERLYLYKESLLEVFPEWKKGQQE